MSAWEKMVEEVKQRNGGSIPTLEQACANWEAHKAETKAAFVTAANDLRNLAK